MVTELIWFLSGSTNIKYLVMNGCHIWDGDAYKNYSKKIEDVIDGYKSGDIMGMQPHIEKWFSNADELTPLTKEEFIENIKTDDEFAEKWGELGPIYGKQWRSWSKVGEQIDQIQNLINELKTNPDSRRLMVSAWNVGELDEMVLPPCHYGFQVYTRELSGEERWELLEKKVGKQIFDLMVEDIVPFGGGLSEELQSYNIPKRAISLMWNQRSCDFPLGIPFNISSYGLLMHGGGKLRARAERRAWCSSSSAINRCATEVAQPQPAPPRAGNGPKPWIKSALSGTLAAKPIKPMSMAGLVSLRPSKALRNTR